MSYRVPTSAEEYNRDNDQAARSALATQIEDVERVTKRIQTSDGTISLGDGTMVLANGANNNVAAGYDTYMQVSGPTAAFSITGIVPVRGAGNTAQRGAIGRWLVLRNPTAYTMTIAHQSGSSDAANRIITSTAADVELAAGTTAMLIYNAAAARWHLVDMVALALTLTTLTVANEGLHLLDTNASHDLIIKPGSDLTADRTLTLTTGDANRTLTLGADSSISGTAYVSGGTDVALADGGTGASLTDPNADRILFWDDSGGAVTWLTASHGLTISTTDLRAVMVQQVGAEYTTMSTTTASIPIDDTIPQNTEGTEILTVAITPKATTNKLCIEVLVPIMATSATNVVVALFQDSTANALDAHYMSIAANFQTRLSLRYTMDAGTSSSTTFKVRVGTGAGTATINGFSGGRIFGGVMRAAITVTEYTP